MREPLHQPRISSVNSRPSCCHFYLCRQLWKAGWRNPMFQFAIVAPPSTVCCLSTTSSWAGFNQFLRLTATTLADWATRRVKNVPPTPLAMAGITGSEPMMIKMALRVTMILCSAFKKSRTSRNQAEVLVTVVTAKEGEVEGVSMSDVTCKMREKLTTARCLIWSEKRHVRVFISSPWHVCDYGTLRLRNITKRVK